MDSVRVNDWISDEILTYHHPLHIKYEMFLDRSGKKISKSAGNVLTPQMWLQYGSPESILLLLFKRITGTRHVGIDDVPALMDEYDYYEDVYFGRIKDDNLAKRTKIKGIYEYINKLNPPTESALHVPYQFIAQQASIFPPDNNRDESVEAVERADRRVEDNLRSPSSGSVIGSTPPRGRAARERAPASPRRRRHLRPSNRERPTHQRGGRCRSRGRARSARPPGRHSRAHGGTRPSGHGRDR